MTQHLIVLKPCYLEAVLAGEKTMECRLSRRAMCPYHTVEVGDILWLKMSQGPVFGRAVAGDVLYYEDLTPARIQAIRSKFDTMIRGNDAYWADRRDCRYATLIRLESVTPVEPFTPEFTLAGPWLVLKGKKETEFSSVRLKTR